MNVGYMVELQDIKGHKTIFMCHQVGLFCAIRSNFAPDLKKILLQSYSKDNNQIDLVLVSARWSIFTILW
jgi:hypothetical protein